MQNRLISALSLLVICSLLFPLGLPAQQDASDNGEQAQEHRPLGSLTSTGEVYVNGVPATADMTVFTGDSMRTGAAGSSTFTIGGQGSVKASANTELDFSANPLFVAELKNGMVVMSTVPGAPNMKVRAGTFVVVAETGDADTNAVQTTCQMQHLADGSFQITSVTGSVGVIALEGPETVFIKAGESVSVTAAGQLSQTAGTPDPVRLLGMRSLPPTVARRRFPLVGFCSEWSAPAVRVRRLRLPDMETTTPRSAQPLRSHLLAVPIVSRALHFRFSSVRAHSAELKLTWSIQTVPAIKLSNLWLNGRATRTTSKRVSGPVVNSSLSGDQSELPARFSVETNSLEGASAS